MKNTLLLLLCVAGCIFALTERERLQEFCLACGPLPLPDSPPRLPAPVPAPVKLPYPMPPPPDVWEDLPPAARLADAHMRVAPPLKSLLSRQGLAWGLPVFIRIIKEERSLELWMQSDSKWMLFRNYPIAAVSGTLGPKTMEGDKQAPEGFYHVRSESLNPGSRFHLSFNLGYPNASDQYHGRTGSFIMVHGAEVSIGCFAMTDPVIEEIYLLVAAALEAGQEAVPVHVFPFRMTAARMEKETGHPAASFWTGLQPGFSAFEETGHPPRIRVERGRYLLEK